jgi:hypothetical protein
LLGALGKRFVHSIYRAQGRSCENQPLSIAKLRDRAVVPGREPLNLRNIVRNIVLGRFDWFGHIVPQPHYIVRRRIVSVGRKAEGARVTAR